MRLVLFLFFFIYLYIEFSLFNAVANTIGVFLTLITIIATSIIGLFLVKVEGIKNFQLIKNNLVNGENIAPQVIKSISLLTTGFLLLIPGFFTDILGGILLLPPTQTFFVKKIVPNIKTHTYGYQSKVNNGIEDDIIEGQFKHKHDE